MKVLYLIPIFLDYRIPFFLKLDELFKGEFCVLYSSARYEKRFPKVLAKVQKLLKHIAFDFSNDYVFNTKTFSFSRFSYEGRTIPITFGLFRSIRKFLPDVIISEGFLGWTPIALIYSVVFRKKLFIHYERTLHTERNVSKILTLQRRIFDNFVCGYLVNGSETCKYLTSLGVKYEKIFLAGMSADDSINKRVRSLTPDEVKEIKQKLCLHNASLIYLYVGRMTKAKGVDKLLSAWKKHIQQFPDDCLLLAGDGELLSAELLDSVERIRVLGRVDYDDIYRLYAVSDVFVIATMQDNWSLVVPEAMSCGVPVATSIYNGCCSDLIIEGVTGFSFDPYNENELLDVLGKFHVCDLAEMGRAAIAQESKFNISASAMRVYEAISRN